MSSKILYGLLLIVLISAWNCKSKKAAPPLAETTATLKDTSPKLSVSKICELRFRRSYAGHEHMTEEEVNKLRKERPLIYDNPDKVFKEKMEAFGFVKGEELLLDKFKYETVLEAEMKDSKGVVAKILFDNLPADVMAYTLVITRGDQTATLKIDNYVEQLKYKLLDVIPGGYPEIVVMNEYYIMNGNNFDLLVFEVKL